MFLLDAASIVAHHDRENGSAMAQRFAAEASDVTAAVGCMALDLLVDVATSYKPSP